MHRKCCTSPTNLVLHVRVFSFWQGASSRSELECAASEWWQFKWNDGYSYIHNDRPLVKNYTHCGDQLFDPRQIFKQKLYHIMLRLTTGPLAWLQMSETGYDLVRIWYGIIKIQDP